MATETETEAMNEHHRALQTYYYSLESRIGYRLVLGGRRHFGYWEKDTYWPFPITRSLERMEDKLAENLNLPSGSYVLDAGCGIGAVALHMAKNFGYRIRAIDVVPHHVEKAQRNIARSKLPKGQVTAALGDYHKLDGMDSESFDGIYTMETFVHAKDPKHVLREFFRLLRPGGHLAQFEYDHEFEQDSNQPLAKSMRDVNQYAAMPTNQLANPGVYRQMLEEAGFTNVEIKDYSDNIRPMTRLFFLLGYIPYLFVTLFGLQRYFINTVAGVGSYRGYGQWHYVAVSATKPGGSIENPKTE